MFDAGNFWFVYLVIASLVAFMLSLGLVTIVDGKADISSAA